MLPLTFLKFKIVFIKMKTIIIFLIYGKKFRFLKLFFNFKYLYLIKR